MAIVLEANYSKKLGLPGYSSHQYSLTIRTELGDVSQINAESKRMHALLQTSVDREIQQTGFLPGNGHRNGHASGNGHGQNGSAKGRGPDEWDCSEKQRGLILKIVDKERLDKNEVEKLAQERFGKPVRKLNKLEASGLIEELFRQTDANGGNGGHPRQRAGAR